MVNPLVAYVSAFTAFFVLSLAMKALFAYGYLKRVANRKEQDRVDVEGCFAADADVTAGEERSTIKCRSSQAWRWKKILVKMGWIQVPNGEEENDRRGKELKNMERGCQTAKVDREIDGGLIIASPEKAASTTTPMPAEVNKVPRPTNVPPFGNFGGYRYGHCSYGEDNMAALPVPKSTSSSSLTTCPHQHQFPTTIVEIDGTSIPSSSPPTTSPLPSRSSKASSVDSASNFALTSYNGFLTSSQDDMTAALPIPKDHPLCQHHPGDPSSSSRQLPKPTGERNLAALQYERESLVTQPLKPARVRHTHVGEEKSSSSSNRVEKLKVESGSVVGEESLQSYRLRRRSRISGLDGSGSSAIRFEARYSQFENPLRQNPIQVDDTMRQPCQTEKSAELQKTAKAVVKQTGEKRAAGTERVLAEKSRNLSFSRPFVQHDSKIANPEKDKIHPQSLGLAGQTANPRDTISSPPPRLPAELDFNVLSGNPKLNSVAFQARRRHTDPPSSLQIGRKPTRPPHHHHRHFSVCDGAWTHVQLTPNGKSPGNPARWSWTAEEVKLAGLKRGHEE